MKKSFTWQQEKGLLKLPPDPATLCIMLSVIQALQPVHHHYCHYLIIIVIHIMVKAWRQWHGHRHRQQPLLEVQQAWEDCHQPEDIKCYFKFSQDDEAK